MNGDLCRRLGKALGTHDVTPDERRTVARASEDAETWDDLPVNVRSLVTEIEQRPVSASTPTS